MVDSSLDQSQPLGTGDKYIALPVRALQAARMGAGAGYFAKQVQEDGGGVLIGGNGWTERNITEKLEGIGHNCLNQGFSII